jgi:hypothetical protein
MRKRAPSTEILSEADVMETRTRCQQFARRLAPLAIKVIADTTRSLDPRLRFSAAVELCKIAGLSQSGSIGQTAAEEQNREIQQSSSWNQLIDHGLTMSETFHMPLPTNFARDGDRRQVDKAAELIRRFGTEEDEVAALCINRLPPSTSSSRK